jgi:hypothetical protein
MIRVLAVLLAVVAGFFVGRHWSASVSATRAAPAILAGETAPRTSASSRIATSRTASSGTKIAVLRPQDAALRARALGGDGRAAAELRELDETCRMLGRFSELTPEMLSSWRPQPPAIKRDYQIALLTVAERDALRDEHAPPAERERIARDVGARLRTRCEGYGPVDAADRYAIALAAAKADNDSFWEFVYEPPFLNDVQSRDGGDDAQLARARDWAERIPRELQHRADAGDADAALALALAYSRGFDDEAGEGINTYPLLNGAIDDDPQHAYRWFARFLQLQPQGPYSPQARRIAERIAEKLDARQRAEAERWLQQSGGAG